MHGNAHRRTILCFPLATWVLIASGCGNQLPKTVPVSGRLLFDGQPPPARGTIYFLPQAAAEGFPMRPGMADFDESGKFVATTFKPGDGLMPGKYAMHVECWQTPPNMEGKPAKSFVPKKYQSAVTSGLTLEVTADMKPQDIVIHIATQ